MEQAKKGYWFSTDSGTHIFVEEGQSKEEAMNKAFDGKSETKEKPLHIQSLEKQVSKNPDYKKIADSLTDDKETNEAFFYAFKDAYERHNYEPSNKHIADELSDRYWSLADGYRDRHGMSDGEWDRYGMSDFEEKYGTEEEFIDKGLNAHNKYFDELESKKEQDFNDPEEAEHNKAEEKDFDLNDSKTREELDNSIKYKDEEYFEKAKRDREDKIEEMRQNFYKKEHDFNDPSEAESNFKEEKETPYKSKYKAEDFEDARFYPTKSTMEGNKWVGRYHSIYDTFDGQPIDDFGSGKFKFVGNHNNTSIYQLPDGYYSINPRITSMSFKTKEALQNYLDKKNPEEHKYGLYYDGDIQRDYRGKDENGKEYGMEGPDAYKAARTKVDINKKIKEQVNDGVTEKDIGYLRNTLQDIPGFNKLSNEEIKRIINTYINRK